MTTSIERVGSTAHHHSLSSSEATKDSTREKIEKFAPDRVYQIGDQALIWEDQICTFTAKGWIRPNGSNIVYFPKSQEWMIHAEEYSDDVYYDKHHDLVRVDLNAINNRTEKKT